MDYFIKAQEKSSFQRLDGTKKNKHYFQKLCYENNDLSLSFQLNIREIMNKLKSSKKLRNVLLRHSNASRNHNSQLSRLHFFYSSYNVYSIYLNSNANGSIYEHIYLTKFI